MKEIEICISLDQVRENIDRIDQSIVEFICEREKYVLQAALFKKNESEVKAPQRVEQVIQKVLKITNSIGGNPAIIEKIYRAMISAFTDTELKEHSKQQKEA